MSYPAVKPFGTTRDFESHDPEARKPAYWIYKLHADHTSSPYRTRAAARAGLTRHLKRGGLSAEWHRLHAEGRI